MEAGDRSYLYLAGFPLGEKAPQTELTRRVDATLNTLNKSLAGYDGAAPLAILAGVKNSECYHPQTCCNH